MTVAIPNRDFRTKAYEPLKIIKPEQRTSISRVDEETLVAYTKEGKGVGRPKLHEYYDEIRIYSNSGCHHTTVQGGYVTKGHTDDGYEVTVVASMPDEVMASRVKTSVPKNILTLPN